MRQTDRYFKFDWITIVLFLLLVGFGWMNILSASHIGESINYFDFSQPYGKQLIFILLTFLLIILLLSIEAKFYERFSSIIYLIGLLSLVGLFIFGKNVNGATSWYGIGGMTIQPSEFAKAATALAVAKYISDMNTDIKSFKDQIRLCIIIALPAILVLLQNDAGSTLVYGSFFFVLYREGLPRIYLSIIIILGLISVAALKFGSLITIAVATVLIFTFHFLRKKRPSIIQPIAMLLASVIITFGVNFFYQKILQPHQQDRISLWLRLEKDPAKIEQMRRDILYNL